MLYPNFRVVAGGNLDEKRDMVNARKVRFSATVQASSASPVCGNCAEQASINCGNCKAMTVQLAAEGFVLRDLGTLGWPPKIRSSNGQVCAS